ncbi:MAG: choice-of-anchor I family protein [Rhodothermaceae bacterium]|nr:choice-of-anchor I family protein [Rhodothermaceae bacterium]
MVHTLRSILLLTLLALLTLPTSVQAQDLLRKIGSFETGIFDDSAAEIVAFDPETNRLFVTNSANTTIDIVDISDPFNPTLFSTIDISVYGGSPTSVDVSSGGYVAVAVPAATETDPGSVVFFGTDGSFMGQATVGALPDMLTFTPDESYVITANEGQPSDDYSIDPEGSISIVDSDFNVQTVTFEAFNEGGARAGELPEGVRIFGPGASVAQDLEPEYVTVSPDGSTVYAIMQENNALAIIDIETASVTAILALGTKDHSVMGNGLDASNRDDAINITEWPVKGMYQPDAITSYEVDGQLYLVTANEGDARDYDTYSEEARVADLTLDPTAFPDAATLQEDANLGRIKTTLENGDTDGDGDYDEIYTYGARSFTIWNATTGAVVFDSGTMIEDYVAAFLPDDFNATNDENDSFDNRSDDKGPEPEALTIGVVGGVPHAFVGLERVGGIMVFDISDPTAPTFADYNNPRDFSIEFDPDTITEQQLSAVGDLGPEGIEFIAAGNSPIGVDMLAVANEVSGSVSLFVIGEIPNAPVQLTVLHNNDGESQLLFAPGQEDFGGAARFKTLMDNLRSAADETGAVLTLSSGDNFLAGPEFQVSLDQPEGEQLFESIALDLIGYDALAIGNHEFDFGPDVLARLINDFGASTPFLSANLDISGEPSLVELEEAGRIAKSAYFGKDGQVFGVVGATTPNLPFVSSPRNVIAMENVAELVQAEIDALTAMGINKIVLISHLQGVEEDQELIGMLTDVDIAIAGGGDELLANEGDLLVPGDDDVFGAYPLITPDMDGNDVPVVTTAGNYKYIGQLIVDFDENGVITSISDASGPVRVSGIDFDAVEEDQDVVDMVTTPVQAALEALANNVIGSSEVGLDGVRGNIRSVETNLGNLITDAYLWQAAELADEFGVDVPQVALANGGGIRNDNVIPAGDITELTTFDILPFGNQLTVVENIPATQFKELLENGVSAIGGSSGTGRFAQLAGVSITYAPTATPQDTDDGVVVTPGERIRRVVLDDGRLIVNNGEVVDESQTIDVVTVNFTANGGDEFIFGDGPFTSLGVTYQKTLANYIVDGLGGTITADDYPEGGEGRITEVQANAAIQLTVLHNNDGESQLLFAPGQEDFGGAARFKTLMDNLRSTADETGAVLTLSSGDNFLAGPEFQVSLDQPEGEQLFESIALNLIGYDALAIGNHEFDFGPDVLARLINDFQAPTPFLSANLDISGEPGLVELEEAGRIAKSAYFVKDGQLFGVVGATTPNLPFVSSPRNVIAMENVAELVQAEVDALTGMGVNKIVLISHLQGIEEDQELIGMLTDVDIAIAGGGDELLANEGDLLVPEDEVFDVYPIITQDMMGNDVPVVTTAGNYKYIGQLIVDFDENGVITMISDDSGPVRVSGIEADAVEEDQDVVDMVTTPIQAALDGLASNVIGSSEVGLDGIRANIRSIETNLGNLITDAYLWQAAQLADQFGVDVPQVALANGGGIRNDNVIPAGDITELTTFDILPFGNQLTVVENIPAAQFKELLENAVSAIGGTSGTGRFAQLGGVVMRYDPAATAQVTEDGIITTPGERVITVALDDGTVVVEEGAVVDESLTIDVVTVNFTANGGDQFIFGEGPFTSLGVTYQKTLANYIVEGLGGTVSADMYPEGGEGRILTLEQSVSVEDPIASELPQEYSLNGNYPNPFNPTTNISFSLPESSEIQLAVYDMLGREVMLLVNTQMSAGNHEVQFAADNLPSGTYFYRLTTPQGAFVKQMILLK